MRELGAGSMFDQLQNRLLDFGWELDGEFAKAAVGVRCNYELGVGSCGETLTACFADSRLPSCVQDSSECLVRSCA